jgi:hypothetical protein
MILLQQVTEGQPEANQGKNLPGRHGESGHRKRPKTTYRGSARMNADYSRFALLRASPAGGKEEFPFCVFTARLKPCPDTCMVDGHNSFQGQI